MNNLHIFGEDTKLPLVILGRILFIIVSAVLCSIGLSINTILGSILLFPLLLNLFTPVVGYIPQDTREHKTSAYAFLTIVITTFLILPLTSSYVFLTMTLILGFSSINLIWLFVTEPTDTNQDKPYSEDIIL